MIILQRKLYGVSNEEIQKSYIPYEEQRKLKRRANTVAAAGAGASALAGATYYGVKRGLINHTAQKAKDIFTEQANNEWRQKGSNFANRIAEKYINKQNIVGKAARWYRDRSIQPIESSLQDKLRQVDINSNQKIRKAGLVGLGIAGVGTALSLGARSIMRRRDKKRIANPAVATTAATKTYSQIESNDQYIDRQLAAEEANRKLARRASKVAVGAGVATVGLGTAAAYNRLKGGQLLDELPNGMSKLAPNFLGFRTRQKFDNIKQKYIGENLSQLRKNLERSRNIFNDSNTDRKLKEISVLKKYKLGRNLALAAVGTGLAAYAANKISQDAASKIVNPTKTIIFVNKDNEQALAERGKKGKRRRRKFPARAKSAMMVPQQPMMVQYVPQPIAQQQPMYMTQPMMVQYAPQSPIIQQPVQQQVPVQPQQVSRSISKQKRVKR
jgi:hypothetical protein